MLPLMVRTRGKQAQFALGRNAYKGAGRVVILCGAPRGCIIDLPYLSSRRQERSARRGVLPVLVPVYGDKGATVAASGSVGAI